MKVRSGFVTNSSTSNFIICNLSQEEKTVKDFILENPALVQKFNVFLKSQPDELKEFNEYCNIDEPYTLPIRLIDLSYGENEILKRKIMGRTAITIMERDEHELLIEWFFTALTKWIVKESGESENFIYSRDE